MKRFIVKGITATILVVVLAFPPVTSVFADGNPSGTGQPSQTCLSSTSTSQEPGNAASAPGSAFNETGPGTAGIVYAGSDGTPSQANGSLNAVAQYDVACFQVSQPQP